MKICSVCKEDLPFDAFKKGKRYADGRRSRCRTCDNEYRRTYLKQHPYKRTGHITAIEYEKLLNKQNNLCAICFRPERAVDPRYGTLRSLAVDHDHITGKIRGLLCTDCNTVLGKMNDDPDRLKSAWQYLNRQ